LVFAIVAGFQLQHDHGVCRSIPLTVLYVVRRQSKEDYGEQNGQELCEAMHDPNLLNTVEYLRHAADSALAIVWSQEIKDSHAFNAELLCI
jgi:hypothetical protein